jgi:peroxiredoxin
MSKSLFLLSLILAALLPFLANAADTAPKSVAPSDPEVKAIVAKINEKLRDKKKEASDFTDELKSFDDTIAAKRQTAPESAAYAAYMKATLYTSVFRETEKGNAMLAALPKDFPGTYYATRATATIASAERRAKAAAEYAVGKKFPGFAEKDILGKPLSIDGYKGKVVLVDFWATWCGPCIGELPNVKKAYTAHHKDGFEIIGISLDSDEKKLTDFIAKNEMPWAQFFDGQGWKNKLAQQYSVQSIPATFLLDGEGTIIGTNLRGAALEAAVEKALKK